MVFSNIGSFWENLGKVYCKMEGSGLPSNTVNAVEVGLGNQIGLATSQGLVMICVE